MASTKKKRQTKHRGNAAGFVETRGRTGRNRPVAETGKKGKGKGSGSAMRQARAERFSKPASWKNAFQRSLFAVVIFVALAIFVLNQKPAPAVALGVFMVLLYTPMSFYMDSYFYKRRQAQAAKAKADAKTAKR